MLSFNINFSTVKVELENVEQSRKDLREGYKGDISVEKHHSELR